MPAKMIDKQPMIKNPFYERRVFGYIWYKKLPIGNYKFHYKIPHITVFCDFFL